MKTIQTLITMFGAIHPDAPSPLDAFCRAAPHGRPGPDGCTYIRVEVPNYERLVIESIDPREPVISVAHYYEQEGDLMKDPEITFHLDTSSPTWRFTPRTYEQSAPPIAQGFSGPLARGELLAINAFTRVWDQNLADQGFITGYQRQIDAYRSQWRSRYLQKTAAVS